MPLQIEKVCNLVNPPPLSTRSECVTSRRSGRVKVSGPDASPAIARGTSCLLPRPPRRGPCSRPNTSGRRLTIRPTLNVLSRRPSALRCLRHSCGHCPGSCDQGCPLGGALCHHQHPTRLPHLHHHCHPRGGGSGRHPHRRFAATPTGAAPAVATVAASLFPPVSFRQLFLRGSARRRGRGPRRGPSTRP